MKTITCDNCGQEYEQHEKNGKVGVALKGYPIVWVRTAAFSCTSCGTKIRLDKGRQ